MSRLRLLSIPLALLVVANTARAQHEGGARSSSAAKPSAEVHQASGGSWNGTASKWGGSPVQAPANTRARIVYVVPATVYVPAVVAAPAPVADSYVVDTVYATTSTPVEMRVITSNHEPRQLTTIEVYRLQPRFQKP
jgi:hypothetical protein